MSSPEFIRLLTTNQSSLYAYILSLVFDGNDAEEVLQQTNSVLWERAADFEIGTDFIAWSFRVAYFQVLAFRKKQQRDRLVFSNEMLAQLAEQAARQGQDFEVKHRLLRHCLTMLNERQREFVRRRYSLGTTIDEIAEECQMTANAVRQLLFRARNALQQCVQSKLHSGVQDD